MNTISHSRGSHPPLTCSLPSNPTRLSLLLTGYHLPRCTSLKPSFLSLTVTSHLWHVPSAAPTSLLPHSLISLPLMNHDPLANHFSFSIFLQYDGSPLTLPLFPDVYSLQGRAPCCPCPPLFRRNDGRSFPFLWLDFFHSVQLDMLSTSWLRIFNSTCCKLVGQVGELIMLNSFAGMCHFDALSCCTLIAKLVAGGDEETGTDPPELK